MSNVGATIVVQFGEGADSAAFVVVELDETLNLDTEGEAKSQFTPGDEVWWWLQHDPTLRIGLIECTSGMVVKCGPARRQREQELTWTGVDAQVELSHIPASAPALTWYGTIGAQFQVAGRQATVTGNTPCTCDAVIPIEVQLYRFVPPPLTLAGEEKYRVVVVITMEAA